MRLRRFGVSGFLLILFAVAGAARQEQPKISVESNEVVVHVRFTDRFGKAIPDIRKDEVRVFEDDKEQKIQRLFRAEEPFDVALLLDLSPSTYDIQQEIRDRSIDFVAQVPETNRMLLITFDTKIYIDCDWTPDLQKVMDTIDGLATNEKATGTHLYEAISLVAQKKFPRGTVRKAMIVYTDGIDHGSDGFSRQQSLDIIEESGILVFPIQYDSRAYYTRLNDAGRGRRSSTGPDYDPRYPNPRGRRYPDPDDRRRSPDPDDPDDPDPTNPDKLPPPTTPPTIGGIILGPTSKRDKAKYIAQQMYNSAKDYLFELARVSSARYFETPSISGLETAYSKIIDELAYVYTVTYIPSEKKDGKLHRIRIDVTRPGVAVLTTKGGYRAK